MDFAMLAISLLMTPLLIGLIAYFMRLTKKHEAAIRERFPPISDAEFVARCAPGTSPKVALRVRQIVADNLGADYDRLSPSTNFVDDLGVE